MDLHGAFCLADLSMFFRTFWIDRDGISVHSFVFLPLSLTGNFFTMKRPIRRLHSASMNQVCVAHAAEEVGRSAAAYSPAGHER